MQARRVVAITGGTRGIGLAVAKAFGREGYAVAVTGNADRDALEKAKHELSDSCSSTDVSQVDARDSAATCAWVDHVVECFGRIDVAVANAGIVRPTPFLEMAEAQVEDVIGVNLLGCFYFLQAAARAMAKKGGGSLISVAAAAAVRPVRAVAMADYAAAKGGVIALTKCLAVELADRGIRANVVIPVADTAMSEAVRVARGVDAATWRKQFPSGELPKPDDVTGVFVFLGSARAKHLTGQVIAVDDGHSA